MTICCRDLTLRSLTLLMCLLVGLSLLAATPGAAKEEIVLATAAGGIRITQTDLDRVIREYKKKARKPAISREEKVQLVQNLVRRELILHQDVIDALRKDADIVKKVRHFENGLVIEKFLEQHIGRHMLPDDAELKHYYRENRQRFSTPAMVEARHILLTNRAEAEQVADKLNHGGDFVQLAKAHSIDLPLAREGGMMAAMPIPKGEALPELDQVLFTLNAGEVSDIVQTQFGYHIVRVDKIIPPTFKSYEEVKDSLKKELMMKRHNRAYDEMARKLEKDADVRLFEDRMQ